MPVKGGADAAGLDELSAELAGCRWAGPGRIMAYDRVIDPRHPDGSSPPCAMHIMRKAARVKSAPRQKSRLVRRMKLRPGSGSKSFKALL